MIELLVSIVTACLILAGAGFALVAAIGLNRFPEVFTRMHAASKAGTVGSGLLLLAVGLHAGDLSTFARAIAGFLFFVLTAPVSAHLLAMAAYKVGYRLGDDSICDEMKRYKSGIQSSLRQK
ncbi:Na+/H+ antiporter subunit G [Neorhizobium sp. SOG26]|jgi:monovalent cation/proton antiporter, MnhG/PhaG subunit|uniref:Monovalent cation/H(+) antiporter subunit G n=1 Tax=Neorhizobium turbinariae TaxID=2937795 RepID=A0ABT0IRH5_9HYPH|nr:MULTISPECIES: monovalent cation/H(+) antiporter subunit G [Neorhizobium]AXV14746.1 Na+/H+ antiporter subunit G [Neorhizobium sp. SOG26]MCK8780460.1 monovalent cation/H(+) antiporter subunit G [Neorhizobium turbinariae]